MDDIGVELIQVSSKAGCRELTGRSVLREDGGGAVSKGNPQFRSNPRDFSMCRANTSRPTALMLSDQLIAGELSAMAEEEAVTVTGGGAGGEGCELATVHPINNWANTTSLILFFNIS